MRHGAEFGWRALVGWIHSYGMLHHTPQDLYRLLPDGFGILFTTLGKMDQSHAETELAISRLGQYAKLLADNGAEFFVANSTPMVTHGGPGFDKTIIRAISDAAGGIPATTTTTAAVNAMRAMGIKKIVLCTPYKSSNEKMKVFLEAEGLEIVHEYGMVDKLTTIHRMPSETAYRVARNAAWEAPECDAIYMPGGRLNVMEVIEQLESDTGLPVIASTPTIVWEICSYFGVRAGQDGFGKLLREFPDADPR